MPLCLSLVALQRGEAESARPMLAGDRQAEPNAAMTNAGGGSYQQVCGLSGTCSVRDGTPEAAMPPA